MQMQFSVIASSAGLAWDGFEASLYDISPGVSERPARASHVMALHLSSPVEGTCRCEDRFVRRVIKPGDIDFIPLGFAATWHDKGPGRVARVTLGPAFLRGVALPPMLSLNDPVLAHLMRAFIAELECGNEDPLFAESLAATVATHLSRSYGHVRSNGRTSGLSRRAVARVTEYIDANLATSFSHADVAVVAGVSSSRLKALFRRSFGSTVHQYVIRQRIERAVQLLAKPGARLCDVAQQCGFSDQSHMTRFMRRIMGITPAALQHRNDDRGVGCSTSTSGGMYIPSSANSPSTVHHRGSSESERP
jgi:AraC family transcriptional regulator